MPMVSSRLERPRKGSKWSQRLEAIDKCPKHQNTSTVDVLGRKISCNCGFHSSVVGQHAFHITNATIVIAMVLLYKNDTTPDVSINYWQMQYRHSQPEPSRPHGSPSTPTTPAPQSLAPISVPLVDPREVQLLSTT